MVECVLIISCYLICAALIHAAHRWAPHWQREAIHYVLVTKDSEGRIELVLRAISLYTWICGQDLRVILPSIGRVKGPLTIMERMSSNRRISMVRSENWHETERVIHQFNRRAKVAGYRISTSSHELAAPKNSQGRRSSPQEKGMSEQATVIYVNRQADYSKIPLFSNG